MAHATMEVFTQEELRKYDENNGIAYIACYGKVHDVSDSYHQLASEVNDGEYEGR